MQATQKTGESPKTAAAAKQLQPCPAHSGGNTSLEKLATLASSERGDGFEPTTKTEAAAKQLQPCTAHSGGSASM